MYARKTKSGNWKAECEYTTASGKRVRRAFTAATKRDAETQAKMWELSRRNPDSRTIEEAMEAFIASKQPVLSPSTIRSYNGILRSLRERFPFFMGIRSDSLKPKDVQRLINDLSKTHTPKTVRNYMALLGSSIPNSAPVFASVTLPARVRPEYHIPDTNAVQTILNASEGTELEIPILLAAVCTMRAGEIAALSVDDIEGSRIHVHRNMVKNSNNEWVVKSPKTYSSDRFVDAPEWLTEKIINQGYVTNYNPTSMSIAFGKMLKRNSLPHCRFHDLRHYSASIMHANGVPTAYIMKRGGWNTETVLNAVYRHALDEQERIETAKINKQFSTFFH